MNISIEDLKFTGNLIHTTTKWNIVELLDGVEVRREDIPHGVGRLSVTYNEYSEHSVYMITTYRRLSDGSEIGPDVVKRSFTEMTEIIPAEMCTPKINKESIMDMSHTSDIVVLTSTPKVDFIGSHTHMSSSWIFRDSSGVVIWQRLRSKDSLNTVNVPISYINNVGVITVEVIYHTTNNKKTYVSIKDLHFDQVLNGELISIVVGDNTNRLVKGITNYISFIKPDYTEPEYLVLVKDMDNNILLEVTTTETVIPFDIPEEIGLLETLVISITGKYVPHYNVTKAIPMGTISLTVDDKNFIEYDIDTANITEEFVRDILPSYTVLNSSLVEISDNIIPNIDLVNRSLVFNYRTPQGLVIADQGSVPLEIVDYSIGTSFKIKIIDNSVLVVCYTRTKLLDDTKETIFKLFSIVEHASLHLRFIPIHTETIAVTAGYTDIEAEVLFNNVEDSVIHWTYTKDKATVPKAFAYKAGVVPTIATDISILADVAKHGGIDKNIIIEIAGADLIISEVNGGTITTILTIPNINVTVLHDVTDTMYLIKNINTVTELSIVK